MFTFCIFGVSSCGRDLLCSECNFAVVFVFFLGFLEECKRHICFKIAYHLLHRLQNIHKPTSTITMPQAGVFKTRNGEMELKTRATVIKYDRPTEISICCRIYFVVNRHK